MATQNKASNKAQDLKGKAKGAAGKVTDNKNLEREGRSDQAKAAVKGVGERVKDLGGKVKDAATKVTHVITRR